MRGVLSKGEEMVSADHGTHHEEREAHEDREETPPKALFVLVVIFAALRECLP
jgi:hypothetical protein